MENLLGVSLFSQKIACHFDGVSIEAADIRKIASYCPQYPAQINGDAIENISLGMPFQVDLINELIEKLKLEHLSRESSGSNVEVVWSGGEKMRIGLARAILVGRQINIFDEPLAPLDPENKIIVSKLLSDLSKTSIVLCITHEKNWGWDKSNTIIFNSLNLIMGLFTGIYLTLEACTNKFAKLFL